MIQSSADVNHLSESLNELSNVKAVLGRLLEQVYQMEGMFPDDDALKEAIAEAEEVLS
jgi:hypothetical protein